MTAGIYRIVAPYRRCNKAPELFKKSAHVFVRMTEEEVAGSVAYIKAFDSKELEHFKAVETVE